MVTRLSGFPRRFDLTARGRRTSSGLARRVAEPISPAIFQSSPGVAAFWMRAWSRASRPIASPSAASRRVLPAPHHPPLVVEVEPPRDQPRAVLQARFDRLDLPRGLQVGFPLDVLPGYDLFQVLVGNEVERQLAGSGGNHPEFWIRFVRHNRTFYGE